MKQYFKRITLCILLSVLLLNGCGKQPSEETLPADTQPSTQTTQSQTESAGDLEEGELPALTIPQQTEPVTQPTRGQENEKPTDGDPQMPATTDPTRGTEPPAITEPTEGTKPSEETKPTEVEPTLPPRFDEDELPPIPVG